MKLLTTLALVNLLLALLSSCVDIGGLVKNLDQQSSISRRVLADETRKTDRQCTEHSKLESQLKIAQDREAELRAGGVTPGEEAELNKIQQDIASLKKQRDALAAAG